MATIKHEVWINAPIAKVYELLATPEGMSSWWDKQTEVHTSEGLVWEHSPGPEHGTVRMLVENRVQGRLLRWKCISHHAEDVPASAWTGTTMTFALGERASSAVASENWAREIPLQTVLSFTHEGWDEASRYLPFCNTAWAGVLMQLAEKAAEPAR
jgi:uncharacterized protein YndB with AHSA1/START domain